MNKYQEALSRMFDNLNYASDYYLDDRCDDDYDILCELIDKATPKKTKLIVDWYSSCYECPNCGISIWCDGDEKERKYCFNCGQALDWSEEDE